ncbi:MULTISPECIES: Arm DNA-binding domain-containing protein [Sphingobium]|uniref:Arm DNA-binding domain-containing protein n=1 Tax=Sphingobium TaxID=165695 RepID=UPI0012FA4F06|nr:Arm DNA-binding domain-containing protein [Sphingobium yanoikuyae]WQE05072.1 Arm DNA-binding domain-containing protein [Sphingobium yanoikuyae]
MKNARPGERDYSSLIPPACTCSSPRKGRSPGVSNRFAGKQKRLTFGLFPDVTLADARDQRDAARAIVRPGKTRMIASKLSALSKIAYPRSLPPLAMRPMFAIGNWSMIVRPRVGDFALTLP